jgi:hypothetical protein
VGLYFFLLGARTYCGADLTRHVLGAELWGEFWIGRRRMRGVELLLSSFEFGLRAA